MANGLRDLKIAALRSIAGNEPVEAIAGMICRGGDRLVQGTIFTVCRATVETGLAVVAGHDLSPEQREALARCLAPVAPGEGEIRRVPEPIAGWIAADSVSKDERIIILARIADAHPLSPRECRLFETCIHLLRAAFAKDALCRRLETINGRFEVALNSMSQGLCFFDGSGRLVLANPRYSEIYDIAPGRIQIGMTLPEIVALRHEAGSAPLMTPSQYVAWRSRVNAADHAVRSVVELGNGRIVEIHNQPMPDQGWVATHEDITVRTVAETQISHMARHDSLTGLANRIKFRECLEAALSDAKPSAVHAVLSLDLDGFKPVNDSFGHPVGDALLQAVAGRLRHCMREHDTVGRLGGDEFAVLALDLDRADDAMEFADRIIRALGEPFQVEGVTISIGVSIGIALSPYDGITPEDLLKRSDIAMYHAKTEARGTHRCFEAPMQDQLVGKLRLENELRDALASSQFELFYQPLLEIESGSVCAFEALLRWRHPERGLISPGEFIPVAEASGLIVPIGAWVLWQACTDAAGWPDHVTVSVNLSPAQFKSQTLVATVREALSSSGVAAARLELEVTESLLLEHDAATLCTLETLSALGVRISMDDFGTGHSSLNYLRRFPFDKLKIDQSYIRDIPHRTDALAIVRAILSLGRSLNIVTTAEGVETEAQLARLREEGCNEVQGFLFSRPRPAADVPQMLLSNADRPRRPGSARLAKVAAKPRPLQRSEQPAR